MRVIAVANQKGGVGKTTSVINIGYGLAKLKKNVMLVDLDPQAHLTYSLGIEAHNLPKSAYDLLKNECNTEEIVQTIDGVTVLPSSLNLSGADLELSGVPGRERLLKEGLERYLDKRRFDFIFIDCPPSLGLLTLNCLTTANEVFVAIQTEFLALQGMVKLIQTIDLVKKRLNPFLEITGVIGTMFDPRKNLSKEVVAKLQENFSDRFFKSLIRENVALAEAPSHGKHIFSYKPTSIGAGDYMRLSKEILKQKTKKK